jgi:hypothetical protein
METEPPLSGWALALVIIAGLVAVTILVGMAVTLWNWLVHGVPPKTQLGTARKRLRAWWEARVLVRARALLRRLRAGKQAAAGKKYEVGDQVELAGGLKSKKPFNSDGGVHEVRVWHTTVLHNGAEVTRQLGFVPAASQHSLRRQKRRPFQSSHLFHRLCNRRCRNIPTTTGL